MPRGGVRRDGLGGRVVSSTLGYRDAMLMVGDGYTFRQLAERLGYNAAFEAGDVAGVERELEACEELVRAFPHPSTSPNSADSATPWPY